MKKQRHDTRYDKNKPILLSFLTLWCAMSVISFSDPCCAQKAVEQKTTGDQSPNINAPSAKSVTVTYGVSEKTLRDLLKGQEGKDKVIEFLVGDLKKKNTRIEEQDAIIQDWIKMYTGLEKLSNERGTNKKIDPLIKFTHQEFIDNFIAFHAYNQYRKTLQLLNPDMLVELLNVYYRSVLLYPSNDMKKYYITASDGRLLLLQIEGHNEKGEKLLISLPDMSGTLLKDICMDFVKTANIKHYEMIEVLFNRAIVTPELDKIQKLNILDAQNFIRKHKVLFNNGE